MELVCGDALEELRKLTGESVQCCVTSPPYWGLRDYGTASWEGGDDGCDHSAATRLVPAASTLDGGKDVLASEGYYPRKCGKCGAKRIDAQLGLEKTPLEYVAKMVEIFREVRRVLRNDGTLWLNLGDSYANTGFGGNIETNGGFQGERQRKVGHQFDSPRKEIPQGLKPKDLCGIPWRVAFALQADGWYLRQDIIWSKPNPMPESVTDRCTKAHEYLFLLTKSSTYFYDAEAIKSPVENGGILRTGPIYSAPASAFGIAKKTGNMADDAVWVTPTSANKRSVWTIATAPYPEAHFATYPPDLIKPCIMAGTSAKGCCAKCGAPWERIMERTKYEPPEATNGERFVDASRKDKNRKLSGADYNEQASTKTLGWQPTCECFGYFEQVECEIERAKGSVPDGWNQRLGGHNDIVDFSRRDRIEEKIELSEKIRKTIKTYAPTSKAEIVPCTVLDPFAGSGTTGAVALELGRKAILIELNPKYIELIEQRCNVTLGLALA